MAKKWSELALTLTFESASYRFVCDKFSYLPDDVAMYTGMYMALRSETFLALPDS